MQLLIIKVDVTKIPRAPPYRPDFMAPSPSVKVEKGIKRPEEPEALQAGGKQRYRYYESDKLLGKLYRAIDEDLFFQDLEDDSSSMFSRDPTDNVQKEMLSLAQRLMDECTWKEWISIAVEVKDQ